MKVTLLSVLVLALTLSEIHDSPIRANTSVQTQLTVTAINQTEDRARERDD